MITSKARFRRKVNAVKGFFSGEPREDAPMGYSKTPVLVPDRFIGTTKAPFCMNCDIFTKVDLHGNCVACGKPIRYVERDSFFKEVANA